jgi:hypothetical protein
MDKTKQNFISVDGKTVRNSYGDFFTIGDVVKQQDVASVGCAIIRSFEADPDMNEIKAITDKGYAHIDFIDLI